MGLSGEQQEWLAAQSADLVARMTGLVERHRELVADSAGVQPRVPVSRAAGADPPVCGSCLISICRVTLFGGRQLQLCVLGKASLPDTS